MGFKEDYKEIYLDPFKRYIVDLETPLDMVDVSAEIIGNRIRIIVPRDKGGNLRGNVLENLSLENSTWIYEPVDPELIENLWNKKISLKDKKSISLSISNEYDHLESSVHYKKDYSFFAKMILEHPDGSIRRMAVKYIDDENVLAALILFCNDKDLSLFILDYIKDVSIICDIIRNDFNYYYFTGVVEIFYDLDKEKLPLKLFNMEIRKLALENIKDKGLLLDLAMDCNAWYRHINMIKDNDLIKDENVILKLHEESEELREVIKDKLIFLF